MNLMRTFLSITVFVFTTVLSAQSLKSVLFDPSFEDFKNPERGWNRQISFDNEKYGSKFNSESNSTLFWVTWNIPDFRTKDLSSNLLNQINNMFEDIRKKEMKVIFRLRYSQNDQGSNQYDAPFEWVLKHIKQIKPILYQNSDVLLLLDAGFIGHWGEWHHSTNGLLVPEKRNVIVDSLLDAVPKDRMIYLRYPVYRIAYLESKGIKNTYLNASTAFNGSPMARIGHLNDCLFTNALDAGTYDATEGEKLKLDRLPGLEYIEKEGAYLPHGGETCEVGENGSKITKWSDCENVRKELPRLGTNHLNRSYSQSVYTKWKNDGCYNEISLSLGYRFVLREAFHSPEVPPGGLFKLRIDLDNKGYGELFNPRDVFLVIEDAKGKKETAQIAIDPRFWQGGKSQTFEVQMEIPYQMSEGTYKLSLWMPDKSEKLKNIPAYAVRFASKEKKSQKDIWDPKTGYNLLASDIRVSKSATGPVNKSYIIFKQNGATNTPIRMVGKNLPRELNIQYNPSTRVIQLNTPTHGKSVNLQLFDALGNKVSANSMETMSSSNQTIWKVNQLRPGIYWARVTLGDKTQVSKIVLPQ